MRDKIGVCSVCVVAVLFEVSMFTEPGPKFNEERGKILYWRSSYLIPGKGRKALLLEALRLLQTLGRLRSLRC